jgi:predicted dehydrogenase
VGEPLTEGAASGVADAAGRVFGVGIVGVGKISEQYLATIPVLPGIRLVAVADLNEQRAAEVAAEQGVASYPVDELIARPEVDIVLNLTIPAAHVEVATKAILAGKHVFGEKPLALAPEDAVELLKLADARGLRVASAPDTVLGTGVQTARQVLDAGTIGDPIGASAFWTAPGHELWHPAPQFYYQPGGGPLFDMGPYYLTTLVTLLGPVVRVSGAIGRSARVRTVATGPSAGAEIPVNIDTHVTAVLEHASGVSSSITVSFEVWGSRHPLIEVYGTLGTISVPDPNRFDGAVEVLTSVDREWHEVPVSAGFADSGRGYGLAELAHAIATNRPNRASGELAFHVLEIMDAIIRAGREHRVVELESTVERPEPVPFGATPSSW